LFTDIYIYFSDQGFLSSALIQTEMGYLTTVSSVRVQIQIRPLLW
jgi:hypothetical protein